MIVIDRPDNYIVIRKCIGNDNDIMTNRETYMESKKNCIIFHSINGTRYVRRITNNKKTYVCVTFYRNNIVVYGTPVRYRDFLFLFYEKMILSLVCVYQYNIFKNYVCRSMYVSIGMSCH